MNNYLKAMLAGVFVLLLILLLMGKCHSCRGERSADVDVADIGGDGDIKITLLWDFMGDVDLHVDQPDGRELSFMDMDLSDSGGGVLDVDDREGGPRSAENAYWPNPAEGHYKVRVVYYRVDDADPRGGTVRVVVKVNGTQQEFDVNLTEERQDVTVYEFDYSAR